MVQGSAKSKLFSSCVEKDYNITIKSNNHEKCQWQQQWQRNRQIALRGPMHVAAGVISKLTADSTSQHQEHGIVWNEAMGCQWCLVGYESAVSGTAMFS